MFKRSQSGQSLIEILVGLGVVSIMVGASTFALVSVLRSSSITEQNQSAGLIGNSLLESATTLAEANWNSIYNVQKTSSNHYFLVRSSTTTPTPVAGDEGVLEQDVVNGLVGYWKFDETLGTSVYDSSGNGNLGNLIGGPIRTASTTCKIGACLTFNGTSSYVNVGNVGSTLIDNFTLAAWVKGDTKNRRIITRRSATVQWEMYADAGSGNLSFFTGTAYNSGVLITDNNWHFVAVGVNGSNSSFYVDGVRVGNNFSPTITAQTLNTEIGSFGAAASTIWNGLIDDVRIYNRALSAAEINQLYNSPIYTRYFYVDNVKRSVCGVGAITTDAESTCIGTSGVSEDPATQKITVGTAWNLKGISDVLENSIYVTRWANSAVSQVDWSGISGVTSAVSDFSTNYFSSNSIEVTASGTIKVGGVVADNPTPITTSISPTSKTAGDAQFTLTVNGTNFISGSVVKFNGVSKTTTYVSPTQLTAVIPAADIVTAGTYSIAVYTLTPGGGTSNVQTLTVAGVGLAGWTYRKSVTITENSASVLTDYPILVTTDTAALITAGKMKSDCSDIRFTDSDKITLLSNYLESGCNTTATKVWVKAPSISASSQKILYFYYGNSSATSISDISTVFDIVNYTNLATYMNSYNEFWFYMQSSAVYFLKVKENGTQFVPGQDVKYTWTELAATAHWNNPAGTSWYGTEVNWNDYGTGAWNYWAPADCYTCYTHILEFVGNGRTGYYSYGYNYHADFVDITGVVTFLGDEGGSSSLVGPLVTYRIKHVSTNPTYVLGSEQ